MTQSSRPRVLIFSLAYFPLVGGAEIAAKEITDRLGSPIHSSVGVDFDLITLRFDKNHLSKEVMDGVNVFRVDASKLFFPIKSAFLARKLHRQNNYQITWSIMAAYAGFGALFFKILYPRVPLLLTLQEGDSESHILKRVGVFYPLWRLIFKKADYIQAISNYLADFARRHGAVCPIEVVPNGVSLAAYKSYKTNRSNRIYTIITTSRLVYKNGVDILIRAVAELKRKTSDVHLDIRCLKVKLLILGDGPDRKSLERLSVELGVADVVKFIGHVDPELIPQYLSEADLFVRPSRSEGLGNSFLEAMAAGLPVIGTSVGGIPDFLINNINGLFCKVDDPNDLAAKIVRILGDPRLSRKLSENGRKTVEENYSWETVASKMKTILNSLNAKPSSFAKASKDKYTPNPRILLATGIYPPDIGGPATYSQTLFDKLPKYGLKTEVLSYGSVRKFPKVFRHIIYFLKVLARGFKSDIIFAQDPVSVGLPACLAARLLGKKFFIKIVGDYAWEQGTQRFGVGDILDDFINKKYGFKIEFLRSVQKFVAGCAVKIIVPSRYLKMIVSNWGVAPDKIKVIYNSFELSDGELLTVTKKEVRSRLNFSGTILISAGRLVPWKGFELLIDLMPEILKNIPDAKLIIIGSGPDKTKLENKIKYLNLGNKIVLLGSIKHEDLLLYLKGGDIFVLNTAYEGLSHQILEAMACGIPVVTTNIGGNPEVIENKVNGLLVDYNNDDQLKKAIITLCSNQDLANKFRLAAKDVFTDFNPDKMLKEVVNVLSL